MRISIYIYDSGKHKYNSTIENVLMTIKHYKQCKFTINLIVLPNHTEIDGKLYDSINIMTHREPYNIPRIFNNCILNSFVNLNALENDLLIIIQDGITLIHDWIIPILDLAKNFNLIQFGFKDEFLCIKPSLIKQVGLFDEQLILHYDLDFYMRCSIICKNKCSINDTIDNILINPKKSIISNIEMSKIELQIDIQDELSNKFYNKWGFTHDDAKKNILILNKSNLPHYQKYYYLFENNINQNIYSNSQFIKNSLYNKYISTINNSKELKDGIYYIANYKSNKYLYVNNYTPQNINGVTLSTIPMEFFVYKNKNKYSIKINMNLINQNNTNGWHIYTVPKNNIVYGAGNDEIWATFDIIKKDNLYLIKSYHNEQNKMKKVGRYLYVSNNNILSDGDESMEECLWAFI